MDVVAFPSAAGYLNTLPRGIDSFPECRVTADSFEFVRSDLVASGLPSGLPPPIAAFLDGNRHDKWLSEVVANAAMLMLRDRVSGSDEGFLKWAYDDSRRVFSKPIYRMLMAVMSPSLVVIGAAKRWSAFHQGTALSINPIVSVAGRAGTQAKLTFPPGLYSPVLVVRQQRAFLAALDAASAKEAKVEVDSTAAGEAVFKPSWSV
jgi:hypothetical protein